MSPSFLPYDIVDEDADKAAIVPVWLRVDDAISLINDINVTVKSRVGKVSIGKAIW